MLATVTALLLAALPTLVSCSGAAPLSPMPTSTPAARTNAPLQFLVMLRLPPQHYHPNGYGATYPHDSGKPARRRAAEELARLHGLVVADNWAMPVIGVDCFLMQSVADGDAAAILAALSRDGRVQWAQPLNTYHGLDGASALSALQPSARYWHTDQLHRLSTGKGVRIALIDSGVDAAHPGLAGQIVARENFVSAPPERAEVHGTGIAGVIAARENGGIGMTGVAPGARLLALRACWSEPAFGTRCNSFTLGRALHFAIMNHVQIINLSLSGPPDALLRALLDAAQQRGMVIVAAADAQAVDGGFPASHAGVIAVAGGSLQGSTGAMLIAPGTDIPTTLPDRRWGFVSGNSYAAAQVSGLFALLAQLLPSATPAQLRARIVETKPATLSGSAAALNGNIDACATIGHLTQSCACLCYGATGATGAHNAATH